MDKFEAVGKKAPKKAGEAKANGVKSGKNENGNRNGKFGGERTNGRANGEKSVKGGKGENGKLPMPRAGERGGKPARAAAPAAAPAAASAAAPVAAPATPVAPAAAVANPAPIRPGGGGKTLADLVRGEPTPAPSAPAAPAVQRGAKAGAAPRGQGGKPAPKQQAATESASDAMNWAKKVAGPGSAMEQPAASAAAAAAAAAAASAAAVAQQPVVAQQPQQPAADSFGFGFEPTAPTAAAPRPQQAAPANERAQAQDLGLQFGNFSSGGADFGFGFDATAAAGWGMQQGQPEASKKQPSRNAAVAAKLPDAVNGSATTTSAMEQQAAAYPAYFGGMMPNAYGNYMMPPAVPMAGGYTGYEGYQQPAQSVDQNGAYADYYKQQAAAQQSQQAMGDKSQSMNSAASSSSAQPMQAFASMPNAYGHPMYSYPYAMPHQPAYPYAVQSHYPYPPAAGVYPGAAHNGKQGANAPPGYKTQDGTAQRGSEHNGARRDTRASQYAEQQMQQGYYANQYAAYGNYGYGR